jgi:hypothetical protein
MYIILLILVLILIVLFIKFYFQNIRPLRPKEKGFEFVYIENDARIRELDNEEKEYLTKKFHPNDGGRPHIKSKYSQLTPDGKILGFIKRNRIPKNLNIEK